MQDTETYEKSKERLLQDVIAEKPTGEAGPSHGSKAVLKVASEEEKLDHKW